MEQQPKQEQKTKAPLDPCFTPEALAVRALVDQLFRRVDKYAEKEMEE